MKVCNKCGKQYDDNGTFCSSCGGMLVTVGNPNTANTVNRNYANTQINNVRNNYQPNMNNSTGSNNQPNMNSNVSANYKPNMINNAGANYQPNTQITSSFHLQHVLKLFFDLMAILSNLFVMVSLGYARVVESPYDYLNANGEKKEYFSPDEDFAIAALVFAVIAVLVSLANLLLLILKRPSIKDICPLITRFLISVALLIASIVLLDS